MTYCAALRDGQAQCLAKHPEAYVIGLGVPGPTGIFGSTAGLAKQFGANRVLDMPASEGGMTGVVLGTAICGMRPILVHMRVDFAVLAMESIVNQAAKWHFMYGGQMRAPITVRMIIGRGWGQGPQHSQSLQAWFAHVPGLKVVMPTTARDAKGMLISAVEDDAPIIIFEHRWLYNVTGEVADGYAPEPLSGARVLRQGKDITLAGFSYMVLECLRAAEILSGVGIDAEVIDLRCLTPIDADMVGRSVKKTGHLIVADTAHTMFGAASEVTSIVVERNFADLKKAPLRVGLPNAPTPTTPALADHYYPTARDIATAALTILGWSGTLSPEPPSAHAWHDVPDSSFKGPY
jgi:acetoin:2,6-dichlorophenolindophenol oxidoreductase subunit beta